MKVCSRCFEERPLVKGFDIDASKEERKDVCVVCEYNDYLQRMEEILNGQFKIKTMGKHVFPYKTIENREI